MKGFRISSIEGTKVVVPSPVNIGELVSEKEFRGQLIHFTEDQWKLTLDQLDPLERMPDEAIRISVIELPFGGGFLGKMPQECPRDDCDPVAVRAEVHTGLYKPSDLPDPETWYKLMCYCVEDEDEGLDTGTLEPPAGVGPCDLQFVPVRMRLPGLVTTIMLFRCLAIEGQCRNCRLGYEILPSGVIEIGCHCHLL